MTSRNPRISMRWWIAGAFAAVAALTALAVVTVLNNRSDQAFRKYAEDFAVGASVSAAERLKHDASLAELRADTRSIAASRKLALFVFDEQGRLLTAPASNGIALAAVPEHRAAIATVIGGRRYIRGSRDGSALVIAVRSRGVQKRVVVAYALRPELKTQLGIVRNEFAQAAIAAFIVGALGGLSIAIFIGRRLARIARAAKAIGDGDLSTPVVGRFPDEVGSLAQSIEGMRLELQRSFRALSDERDRLERQERVQREFATNAAHELRTPLASVVTAIEMLQTGAKDDASARDEFLAVIEREAARLSRLTRALLVLARAEAHQEAPQVTSFELRPVLETVLAGTPAVPGVELGVDCEPRLLASGDPLLLEQAVAGLALNAVQHTTHGSVMLRARREDGQVVVEVDDSGSGIPADEQARVFDRFYRARNGSQLGFGLGLSIARDATRVMGGSIRVTSEPGTGTTVEIRLPAGNAEVAS